MLPMMRTASTLLALTGAASAYNTCVVPFGGPGVDDAATVRAMLPNCSTNAEIIFSSCTTYNISTAINFGTLSNVTVSILGNLNMPSSIPYIQSLVNVTGSLSWFTFKGSNVTLQGNTNPNEGFVYWHGEQWWKAAQYVTPLGGLPLRPHGFSFNVNNTIIRNMKISKPIAWQFALSGSDYVVHNNWIDADYDLSLVNGFPFNTDGYDVKGPRFHFYDNQVANGDDCVAVNNGAHDIRIENMLCEGGHGISLSGTDNISNVTFNNITSRNSLYATRFKSSLNSKGNISDVHWSNIYVENATYPVFATSVYFDQNTNRGMTPGVYPANSTATHISNFTWTNVTGTINDRFPGDGSCTTNPCWYAIAGITNTAGVTMQLLNGTASGIHLENINLLPIDGKGVSNTYCNPNSFVDSSKPKDLGFVCENGPYRVKK